MKVKIPEFLTYNLQTQKSSSLYLMYIFTVVRLPPKHFQWLTGITLGDGKGEKANTPPFFYLTFFLLLKRGNLKKLG
jgi:hypothetical protein